MRPCSDASARQIVLLLFLSIAFVLCAPSQVHRERTFFMAIKEGFKIPEGFSLMTAEQAEAEAHKVWNPQARPQVQDWLNVSQSPDDKRRLHSMGNIVYPRQARLAMRWILRQVN